MNSLKLQQSNADEFEEQYMDNICSKLLNKLEKQNQKFLLIRATKRCSKCLEKSKTTKYQKFRVEADRKYRILEKKKKHFRNVKKCPTLQARVVA